MLGQNRLPLGPANGLEGSVTMPAAWDEVPDEAHKLQSSQRQIRNIEFPPAMKAVGRAAREGMVIVMPAVAVGCEGEEPVVAAILIGLEVAIAPQVARGVHSP